MKFWLKVILPVSFLVISLGLQAQNKRIVDSLENVLKLPKTPDTSKVKAYCDIAWEYIFSDMNKAISYGKMELDLATKINYKSGMGHAHHDLGSIYVAWGKYSESREEFKKALEIRKALGDKRNIAASSVNLAAVENYLGNYIAALNLSFENLKIFEELNEKHSVAKILGNIGSMYYSINNNQKGLEYSIKAYDFSKENNDKGGLASSAVNLGTIYLDSKDYPKSEKYFLSALESLESLKENSKICIVLNDLGHLYVITNNNQKALEYLNKALKISRQNNIEKDEATSLVELGNVYANLNNLKLAEQYYLKGIEISKNNGLKNNEKSGFEHLSKIYALNGDYKKALQYYADFSSIKDSMVNEGNLKQIAEIQTKYETEKKEKENIELKQKNQVQQLLTQAESSKRKNQLMLSFGFTGLIVVSGGFLYNRRKLKQEAILASERANQERLRFTAIIDAEEKERVRIAKELHDGLGQLLSTARLTTSSLGGNLDIEDEKVLESSLKIIDHACEEVRNISHNMMPVALIRMGLIPAIEEIVDEINRSNKIEVDLNLNINSRLPDFKEIAVYRIVQEVLNNMIKHSEANKINIAILQSEKNIEVRINDNGKGFDTSTIIDSKGLGWKNIYSRTTMLGGNVYVKSSSAMGTEVSIVFPV